MMLANTNPYTLLADLILAVHFAFVTFVVAGLVLIWVGFFLHWTFVRDWRFRIAHLLAMAFVLGESLTGFICPLTTWENQLRLRGGGVHARFVRNESRLERIVRYRHRRSGSHPRRIAP